MKNDLIVILGPTASGKTKLAVQIAHRLQTEIISADSRQVYKRLNLGTGKDLAEYMVDNQQIKYHLIDVIEPFENFNVYEFQNAFNEVFLNFKSKQKPAILCGGTGMYIEAILKGFKNTAYEIDENLRQKLSNFSREELLSFPEKNKIKLENFDDSTQKRLIRTIEINLANHQKPNDFSVPVNPIIFGLTLAVEDRNKLIYSRLLQRLDEGMIQEVAALLNENVPAEKFIFLGLEYKLITEHLLGRMSKEEMIDTLFIKIRQFAKRQMTFFRSMERKGMTINWLQANWPMDEKLNFILKKLEK